MNMRTESVSEASVTPAESASFDLRNNEVEASKAATPDAGKKSAGNLLKKIVDWFMEDDDLLPGETPESHAANVRTNRRGMAVLYRKELADHLCSRRFWALFALLMIVSVASLYGAIGSLRQTALAAQSQGQGVSEFQFLKLFTTAGSSIYSFQSFIGFLGPIFGIMLGFDAINNEQAQGTLNRLAAQPIYRDTIINAKFLAGATVVFLTVFSLGGVLSGLGLLLSGTKPVAEEWARLVIFLILSGVYISVWLAISVLFSTLSRHAATSALSSIALWLFLTMFLSLVASGLANAMFAGTHASAQDVISAYRLQTGINRISPYYLFSEAASVLMNPNVRSLDIMSLVEYQNGALASYLSLGQSLLQIWPHLVAMIMEVVIGFALAYIIFMRKEIRA